MKIALASAPVKNRNIPFNLQTMADVMENLKDKADIVLFGESVLQGFYSLCWDYETDKGTAVALTDAPIQKMRRAAEKNRIAVSFGFIEHKENLLYSSQIFIGADGSIVNLFRRVSVGWKEYTKTDDHYREGMGFEKFSYGGKTFSTGLCGDLWTDGRPEEMKALNPEVVLWPVWCDYKVNEWNTEAKSEYAEQAALCGSCVLLANPFCADPELPDTAAGGAVYFKDGGIAAELPAGKAGHLIVPV